MAVFLIVGGYFAFRGVQADYQLLKQSELQESLANILKISEYKKQVQVENVILGSSSIYVLVSKKRIQGVKGNTVDHVSARKSINDLFAAWIFAKPKYKNYFLQVTFPEKLHRAGKRIPKGL